MKSIFGAFALVLTLAALPGAAMAAPTSIAQLPILNLDDTGAVKPNLMLLYDNSGSMASAFTPDNLSDGTTCRSRISMAAGTRACTVGNPPFNSPEFNRQYYDPAVLYVPPVKDDGSSYPMQNSDNTSKWMAVTIDAFGINTKDLLGNTVATSNLVSGFPDMKWCDSTAVTANCDVNSATYAYPNATLYNPQPIAANPYYYTIRVAEYCTDDTLKNCKTTNVGDPAPAGFPKPAKIRWCDTTALTNCQAKYVGAFKYPRFSSPTGGAVAAYGTILVNASATNGSIDVTKVAVIEAGVEVVITNGTVNAPAGTNVLANQVKLAEALAASIIARTGLANPYTACVYKPLTLTTVPACSTLGITLASTNNMVAVVPLKCIANATGKDNTQCDVVSDTSHFGWPIVVTAPTVVTTAQKAAVATITITGIAAKKQGSTAQTQLTALTLNGTSILNGGALTFNSEATSADVAAAVLGKISGTGISAVRGGTGTCTGANTIICISTTASYAAGQKIVATLTSAGTLKFAVTTTVAGTPEISDAVSTTTASIGSGAAIFVRTDIVPTNNSYPKAATRIDCAGTGVCTYAEEMTNVANWYAYYRTRNQMMKTSVGLAFQSLTANFNVGVVSLSSAAAGGTMTPPLPFSDTARTNWYTKLYAMNGSDSTPLRPALDMVGRMYANQKPYNTATYASVVKYPCQQNYTFLTTDGYWNGAAATGIDGGASTGPLSNDEVENPARFCLIATGCVDSNQQSFNSLADVALYWYNGGSNGLGGSLRPALEDVKGGAVPGKAGENLRLHMNTYTLGLGVDGIMTYEDNYDVQPVIGGDFYNLTHAVTTGCPWTADGKYAWPDPATTNATAGASVQTRVDDLWHTAINGHGKYFSASNPTQVVTGLRSALSNIVAHSGAAAAAATSTPNITLNDNDLFSNSFTTVQWSGELTDKKIDPVSGAVIDTVIWSTSNTLGLKVGASTDTRVIKMLDTTTGTFKDFSYANMSALEKGWFDNKCSALAQCTALTAADRATVNSGATIVNWLRGQQQYANDLLLRAYGKVAVAGAATTVPLILGDIASSKPAYVRDPRKLYAIAGYSDFVLNNAARKPAVYVGANDGMLHAFDAANGDEMWAYVPRITMSKLYIQASTTYGTNHQYTVDGAPEVGDVQIGTTWKTVLVSGLAGGGRGYFALDVTDPANPKPLWETCADKNICTGNNFEPEIGLTFGNPQFGTWKDNTGAVKWVVFVTSGYNNIPNTDGVPGGTGKGFLMVLDVATGKVLDKYSTGSGDTTTPSGLARTTAITADPNYDPLVTFVYGGDNQGQMWRFDMSKTSATAPVKMGDAGVLQPVTARPDVTYCSVQKVDASGVVLSTTNQVMVAFGTGRLLDVVDLSNKDKQSLYVLKDRTTDVTPAEWRSATMAKETLSTITAAGQPVSYKTSGLPANLATQIGWYTDFDQNAGERVNLDPLIVQGAVNVVTNIPDSSTSCKVGGSSIIYAFNVCTGVGTGVTIDGGAASAGFSIVSTGTGLVAEVKGVDGKDRDIKLTSLTTPETRRSGWRRIRN